MSVLSSLPLETVIKNRDKYAHLVPEFYRCCLEGHDPYTLPNEFLHFYVLEQPANKPIGFAICATKSSTDIELYSLFIEKSYRNRGWGSRLLSYIESDLHKKKHKTLRYTYNTQDQNRIPIEKLFAKANWSSPTLFQLKFSFDAPAFNPVWIRPEHPLPLPFEEFCWSGIEEEEKKQLKERSEREEFPPSVSPFEYPLPSEPINSLGLRCEGKIVGWIITHRTAPDTIRYSALYIDPRFRRTGLAIKLLIHSMKLHKKSGIQWAFFEINQRETSASWAKFVNRRLLPHACKSEIIQSVSKKLSPA